jgi:CheY-like chemotaxis protein
MIEPFGVQVEIAADGRQALQRATEHRYDLILMDMQMPLMDGIEATRRLREARNQTPIVALTANVMQHQRATFEAAGCNDFLSKPIHSARLLALLRAHLQPRKRAVVAEVEVQVNDELRVLFLERMMQLADELEASRVAGQQESLLRVLHTIKGSIGSFGYLGVSQTAEQAEEALERREMVRAAQRIDLLREQIKDILAS